MFRLIIPLLFVVIEGFFINIKAEKSQAISKITFDISTISESGLIGTGTGVRSLAYEFCIPANPTAEKEVRSIDPSLKIYRHSPGRIGCRKNQYLCIGETHQPKWREKLLNLENLAYIEKIQPFHGE